MARSDRAQEPADERRPMPLPEFVARLREIMAGVVAEADAADAEGPDQAAT